MVILSKDYCFCKIISIFKQTRGILTKELTGIMSKKIKIIFMGTPDFALPSLQGLIDDKDFDVLAVVTQEDKKIGRKQELTAPPVKQLAQKHNIPVFQPQSIKMNDPFLKLISDLEPDIIVVVAYGQIFPQKLLDIPKFGAINVHASLLPKYRGASPIEAALLNGDKETGVAIMKMAEQLDAGAILEMAKIHIAPDDNADTITVKLSILGGKILPLVLKDLVEGALRPIPQDESKATFCRKIEKDDGLINLKELTAAEIHNRIRAYTPWPSAFLMIEGKRLKLVEAIVDENTDLPPETVKDLSKNSIAVGTKKGVIIPIKVQLEGKKMMTIQEFLAGNRSLLTRLLTNPK
jgi:methionyl-tRNA formyltransferase